MLPKRRSRDVSSMPWGYEGRLSSGRTVLSAPRPARPHPAAPCAPTRPARGMSGFWTRQARFKQDFLCSFFRRPSRTVVFDALEVDMQCCPWAHRSALPAFVPTPPRPAAPPGSTMPGFARGISRFWIRQVEHEGETLRGQRLKFS